MSSTPVAEKTGVGSGIRISIAIAVALATGCFMLLWDGGYIPHGVVASWVGPFVFTPLIAVVLGFGGSCGIQQLSCGTIQWFNNFIRVLFVPIAFITWWTILHFITSLRWPIEGLFQNSTPEIQRGLSSGFYAFWLGLYSQSILNGVSQLCPT